jgi:predicted nucleic acid-binding protein
VTDKIVDASAIVALLFHELTSDKILRRVRHATLRAPKLIGFEVASACLKKIRAEPGERDKLLEAFSLLDALSIHLEAVDLRAAVALAEQAKLTLYDASYLWLARTLDAELVTLDERLARADGDLRRS